MTLDSDNRWKEMTPNQKGAIGELIACNWLLMDGYSVYKNVSPWGAVDIIALKNEECIFIDVAIASSDERGNLNDRKKNCAEHREKSGIKVRFLYVLPDGTCKWREDLFPKEMRICRKCQKEYECKISDQRKRCEKCFSIPPAY